MLKIIICDDNQEFLDRTSSIINKCLMSKDIEYRIIKFLEYNEKFYEEINDKISQKIYILDIEMPVVSGLEIASMIRKDDWQSIIIFLTAYNEYKDDVFYSRLMPIDYIGKKELFSSRLVATLEESIKILNKDKVFVFKYRGTTYRVMKKDILYIEKEISTNDLCLITTIEDKFKVKGKICDLVKILGDDFFLTHQSCIVNLSNVKEIDYIENKIIFFNDIEIYSLASTRKKALKNYVENY